MIDLALRKQLGSAVLDMEIVTDGGVTALFGPSGAGKTSCLNMIAGLLRPDQGHIIVDGVTLFDSDRGANLPPERRRIGYVFQDLRLFPHLSVRGNLDYGRRFARAAYATFDPVVAMLGLEPLLGRRPDSLSGGERQRVAIGRALLAQPRLLLLDEPLASLDAARKEDIFPYLERLKAESGIPMILVSHSEAEVSRLADRVITIHHGRCVTPDSAISEPGR